MPHSIAIASSGRAKCRGCKQAIKKGELRFGDAVPNPFGDGEAVHWYHLECGARRRAASFLEALDGLGQEQSEGVSLPPDDVERLRGLASLGKEFYRLERFVAVQVASSGRARCQGCRELIEKGALRFALERIEDGIISAAGFVHVGCAHSYAGAAEGIWERVRAVTPEASLSAEQWAEVEGSLKEQAQLPREIKVPYAQRD